MPENNYIKEYLQNVKELLIIKNAAYGDSALNPLKICSTSDATDMIKIRIDDKLSRLRNRRNITDSEDTIKDIVGYIFLFHILRSSVYGDENEDKSFKDKVDVAYAFFLNSIIPVSAEDLNDEVVSIVFPESDPSFVVKVQLMNTLYTIADEGLEYDYISLVRYLILFDYYEKFKED